MGEAQFLVRLTHSEILPVKMHALPSRYCVWPQASQERIMS